MNCADYGNFVWPALPGADSRPAWNGSGFRVGNVPCAILEYQVEDSGWSRELTLLHEESAARYHPIDVASRQQATRSLAPILARNPKATILEIGSSSGYFLDHLREAYPSARIVGSDYIREVVEEAANLVPSVPMVQMDILRCPFADGTFDAVVALNVLEHIEDDGAAVRQLARILKPGGSLILEVPAAPHLYDSYDEHLKHSRRYRMRELKEMVRNSGLKVVRASHLGFLVYPAFYFAKKRKRAAASRGASADESGKIVEGQIRRSGRSLPLGAVLAAEAFLGRVITFPFGIRCLVRAKKPLT